MVAGAAVVVVVVGATVVVTAQTAGATDEEVLVPGAQFHPDPISLRAVS
jgi:hypothetical protein